MSPRATTTTAWRNCNFRRDIHELAPPDPANFDFGHRRRAVALIDGGHYFIRDNEIHYELSGAKDKDFIVVAGDEHGQTPCAPCESTPGQYSNAVKNFYDYTRDWIQRRF